MARTMFAAEKTASPANRQFTSEEKGEKEGKCDSLSPTISKHFILEVEEKADLYIMDVLVRKSKKATKCNFLGVSIC